MQKAAQQTQYVVEDSWLKLRSLATNSAKRRLKDTVQHAKSARHMERRMSHSGMHEEEVRSGKCMERRMSRSRMHEEEERSGECMERRMSHSAMHEEERSGECMERRISHRGAVFHVQVLGQEAEYPGIYIRAGLTQQKDAAVLIQSSCQSQPERSKGGAAFGDTNIQPPEASSIPCC